MWSVECGYEVFLTAFYFLHSTFSSMLSYNDLKKGTLFVWEGQPYEVLEYNFVRMQQRRPSAQVKIKNIKTGSIAMQSFKQSDTFNEVDLQKKKALFLFSHKGQYTFHLDGDPKNRFVLTDGQLGDKAKFLKPNTLVEARYIEDELLDIALPIKMEFIVVEAPPAVRGNTAQGGVKQVKLENGLTVNTPLFINEGDIVRVNTELGEYVERVTK